MSTHNLSRECEAIWPLGWNASYSHLTYTNVHGTALHVDREHYFVGEARHPRSASLRADLQHMREQVCAIPRDIPELTHPLAVLDGLLTAQGWKTSSENSWVLCLSARSWLLTYKGGVLELRIFTNNSPVYAQAGVRDSNYPAALTELQQQLPRFT